MKLKKPNQGNEHARHLNINPSHEQRAGITLFHSIYIKKSHPPQTLYPSNHTLEREPFTIPAITQTKSAKIGENSVALLSIDHIYLLYIIYISFIQIQKLTFTTKWENLY